MASSFECQETTLVYDHVQGGGTVELYTTNRRLWLRTITRNPNFIKALDLNPGYLVVYPAQQVRSPELMVSPRDGGAEVARSFMSDTEIASRDAACQRLKEIKGNIEHTA